MLMRIFMFAIAYLLDMDENYHGNLVRECCETCTSRRHGNRTEQKQNINVNFRKKMSYTKDGKDKICFGAISRSKSFSLLLCSVSMTSKRAVNTSL